MDKLKYIKLENEDGSYSDSVPLSVDSDYVDVSGNTLEEILGNINILVYGNLATQLEDIRNRLDALEGNDAEENNSI